MKKQNFSSFTLTQAYQHLQIQTLQPWEIPDQPIAPTPFFAERLQRLQNRFDLRYCEKSKELLIDAFCEEALENIQHLKIWKGAKLETPTTNGNVDYLIAPQKDYLDTPGLCIVEAKKDDFQQGLAQCLVEMKACQIWNQTQKITVNIFGIVTNGEGWRFYQLTTANQAQETALYSTKDIPILLGALHQIFSLCQTQLCNLSPNPETDS